jgi:hypothetical protein
VHPHCVRLILGAAPNDQLWPMIYRVNYRVNKPLYPHTPVLCIADMPEDVPRPRSLTTTLSRQHDEGYHDSDFTANPVEQALPMLEDDIIPGERSGLEADGAECCMPCLH